MLCEYNFKNGGGVYRNYGGAGGGCCIAVKGYVLILEKETQVREDFIIKIFLILVLLVLISGCIVSESDEETLIEEEINMDAISVSSDIFENGGMLSSEYTCDGNDVSPDLSWDTVPAGTQSIALIVDDPDAPGQTFVHWVIYNIPADSSGLPPGVPKNKTLPAAG